METGLVCSVSIVFPVFPTDSASVSIPKIPLMSLYGALNDITMSIGQFIGKQAFLQGFSKDFSAYMTMLLKVSRRSPWGEIYNYSFSWK